MKKRILCFLLMLCVISLVIPKNIVSASQGYMDNTNAKYFLAFIYNSNVKEFTDERLSGDSFYKLLTGQLSDDKDYETATKIQFLFFMDARIQQTLSKNGEIVKTSSQSLIEYFNSEVYGTIESSITDLFKATVLESIVEFCGYDGDALVRILGQMVDFFQNPAKYSEDVLAITNVLLYSYGQNIDSLYTYFDAASSCMSLKSTEGAYETAMSAYKLMLSDGKFMSYGASALIPGLTHWTEWTDQLDYWAEYAYNMRRSILSEEQGATSNSYTITFNSNCSNVNNITRTYSSSGDSVTFPSMSRYNYTFDGWYWEPECINEVSTFTKVDHTFYAKWTPVPMYEYSISTEGVTITKFLNFMLDDNGNKITNIIIPSTLDGYPVIEIGACAFEYNYELTGVTIPESVTDIGIYAFNECYNLKRVILNEGLITIGERSFSDCGSVTSVVLPDSVQTIGESAFENTNLTKITFGDKVSSIGIAAFANCPLSQIIVENDNSFFCSDEGVLFNKDKTQLICFPKEKEIESYIVPDSVQIIGARAFFDCENLTSVRISDSVKLIEDYAFAECIKLKNVELGKNVEEIGDSAFFECDSLVEMAFEGKINYLGWSALAWCDKLEEVTIAGNITEINYCTFAQCGNLKKVSILGAVDQICDYAFEGCYALESIILPKSIEQFWEDAFSFLCSAVWVHPLPHTLNVYYEGTSEQWHSIDGVFYGVVFCPCTTIHYNYGTENETTFGTRNLILTNMEPVEQNGQTIYRVGLFAAVDSLEYSKVGYEITCVDDGATKEVTTKNVYDAVSYSTDNGKVTRKARGFGDNNKYIFGFIEGFSEKYKEKRFKFRPFAIDLTGKKHYGNYTENIVIYTK